MTVATAAKVPRKEWETEQKIMVNIIPFTEAIPKLLVEIQESPNHPPLYRCLAACYAHMGRLDEAREVITRLRAITPVVVPSMPYRNPGDREFFLSGLRLAAGETT